MLLKLYHGNYVVIHLPTKKTNTPGLDVRCSKGTSFIAINQMPYDNRTSAT